MSSNSFSTKAIEAAKAKAKSRKPWRVAGKDMRAIANKLLEERIVQIEEEKQNLIDCIAKSREFVTARIEAENERAAILSMKQVIRYEAELEQKCVFISNLEQLLMDVQGSPTFFNVKLVLDTIFAQPPPKLIQHDHSDELQNAAEQNVKEIKQRQIGAMSA